MLFLWLGYNERQQHYTCLRCEVQFDAILHLCAFVGLLPLFFQTCFCMEKKRTALNADQSQVTKSAKNFRGWQSQVTKSAKRFGGPLQGIEPTLADLQTSAYPLDQWQVLKYC